MHVSFQEIVHVKRYFANVDTITARTTITIYPQLTKRHVVVKHFESETVYKIIDVYIVTHLSPPRR
jgi:hypothetical protein